MEHKILQEFQCSGSMSKKFGSVNYKLLLDNSDIIFLIANLFRINYNLPQYSLQYLIKTVRDLNIL